ncbi:hypothetical protein P8452_61695 [Trifolium repens]|nr:hypothetical protein P8452_61695 [Trifolium repens]
MHRSLGSSHKSMNRSFFVDSQSKGSISMPNAWTVYTNLTYLMFDYSAIEKYCAKDIDDASIWWMMFQSHPKRSWFKVHIQVIDSTGLTTFVWFDGVASDQVLGRSVHDLLGGVNQMIGHRIENNN